MFLVNFGSFWILSFVFCLSFLLCFWVASARFSGISVFVGPCFLKINFVQHWQSLSASQNYSSKIQALDFSTLFLSTKIKWKKDVSAQKKTPETHRSKPERKQERQRKQKRKKPKSPQIAKKHQKRSNCTQARLVQSHSPEIHHTTGRRNLDCCKTSQNGDCLLL